MLTRPTAAFVREMWQFLVQDLEFEVGGLAIIGFARTEGVVQVIMLPRLVVQQLWFLVTVVDGAEMGSRLVPVVGASVRVRAC